jgi:hypothetical protein
MGVLPYQSWLLRENFAGALQKLTTHQTRTESP